MQVGVYGDAWTAATQVFLSWRPVTCVLDHCPQDKKRKRDGDDEAAEAPAAEADGQEEAPKKKKKKDKSKQ